MDHENETAAFAVQAKEGQDPDLKAFAAQQLPILKEHLQKARDLVAQQHTAGMSGPPTERRGTR
jgi:putative membrane protein